MSARNTDSIGSTIRKVKSDSQLSKSIGSKKHGSRNPGHGTGTYPQSGGDGDQGGYPTQFPLKPPVVHYGTVDGVLPIDIDMTKFYSTGAKMIISGNVTINLLNPPAPGKSQTVKIIVKQDVVGGHTITWGSTVINNPQPDVLAGVETVFELTTYDQGFTFHRSGTGSGGSGLADPARQKKNIVAPVTLPGLTVLDWSAGSMFSILLDKSIELSFINPPPAGDFQITIIKLIQNGVGNHTVTFPSPQTLGSPEVSLVPNSITTFAIYTEDNGSSYIFSNVNTQDPKLSKTTIDVNKSWAGKSISDMGGLTMSGDIDLGDNNLIKTAGIDMDGVAATIQGVANLDLLQLNQSINSLPAGLFYQTAAQQKHEMIIGGVPVARFEETTPGNYINQFLALLNMNGKQINNTKHIAFDGLEGLVKTTESGIGMDNVTENAMIYNVPLTAQTHNFKAAGELLAAISRVGTNSGLLSIDNVISKSLQADDSLRLFPQAGNPSPLLDGMEWYNSTDDVFKVRRNLTTEDMVSYTPDPLPITGDLLVKKSDGTFHELLRGANGKVLTANSASPNGLGLEWQVSPASDNLGDHKMLQNIDGNGFSIDNILALISNAVNPATVGAIRLGNSENIFWRDAGNTSNIGLTVNSLDEIVYTNHLMPSVSSLSVGKSSKRIGTLWGESIDLSNTLMVAGNTILNGDLNIGNAIGDELSISAKIVSDLKMDNGFVIEPTVGSQIGYYVERTGTLGTRGGLGVPFETGFETTAAGADISFGNSLGSLGVYGRNDTSPALLVIKVLTSPSKWKGVLLNDITLT